MKRALALGLSAVAIAGLGLVGNAGSASAACARTEIYTGNRGPGSQPNQFNISSTSTCKDLNIIDTFDTGGAGGDTYAGFYYSNNRWQIGSRGYVEYKNVEPAWKVLLSDISNGALVTVGSWNGSDWITVAH